MAHKTIPKSKINLNEGEKTFHLLFEGHPIPMFVVDLQTRKFLKVNETMAEKYGYSCDEFQALTLQDILPMQDAARLRKPAKKEQPGLLPAGEWRHQCRDGRVIDVDITSHTLEFDGHPAALVIAQDITERKKAEQSLRESEKRYHSLFDSMLDGIYRSTPEGKFIYVNQSMVNMFGYSSVEEMLEVDIINELYFAPEERHSSAESILNTEPEVYRMRRKDGTEIWVEDHETYLHNEQGKTIYHGGMLRDVTTRKQAEQALRESEERYQLLFNNMLDGYYRSTHEGKFVDINLAMVKMFGYSSREEMLEVDIKNDLYFAPEERGSHILDTGQKEVEEYCMRRKDGSEIWVEDHGYYMHNEQGMPIFHEGILRDITERKQAEQSLAVSEAELRALFASMQDVVLVIDHNGVYRKIAPTNPRLLVKWPDDLLGKNLRHIFPSDQADTFINAIQLVLEKQQTSHIEYELTIGEQKMWFATSVSPMDYENTLWVARDITERKKAEEALRTAEANYRTIFENATVGIYQSTPQGRFLSVNPAMAYIFGYDLPEEMVENIVDIEKQYYVDPGVRREFQSLMSAHGEVRDFCSWNYSKNGGHIWIEESARTVKDGQGNILYYEGFVSDITERKQSEDELLHAKESLEHANRELEHVLAREQQLARTDGLTGLYNYRYFFELASREFSASMRYQRPLAILMFDTDDFKQINDTLGHAAGDKILTLVAQTTAEQMRAVDVLARYGGDEFVILLAQTSAQQAFPIAERIRASVTALQIQTENGPSNVTLSIGIAELWRNPADESVESIVQRADKALYAAKQAGRNRTVIFG